MPLITTSGWLKNVLIAGGEKFVSTALWSGYSAAKIYDSIVRRFGVPEAAVFQNLIEFGESAVRAGEILQNNPTNIPLAVAARPINPFLFGDEPGGRREFWRTRITHPDIGKSIFVDVNTPDMATWEELLSEGEAGAVQVFTMYPGKFGFQTIKLPPSPTFEIVFGEARF